MLEVGPRPPTGSDHSQILLLDSKGFKIVLENLLGKKYHSNFLAKEVVCAG
jgi:hypothetical protein